MFAKTREFDDVVTDPFVLGVVEDVLGSCHVSALLQWKPVLLCKLGGLAFMFIKFRHL